MNVRFTKSFLTKLEDIFSESNFNLRYEKGNFKSGYCILNETNIVIINKYYSLEGKINCLIEIIINTDLQKSNFSDKSLEIYNHLTQTKLEI